ncbi:CRE-NPR-16 protein [Aphelenchoides avenae]|nr:CRE-NPR-16 protein [Aphelenchus avenae]
MANDTLRPSPLPPSTSASASHLRTVLTVTHLCLVVLGSVNLLVIFVICMRRYMRSITNVYMISLCLADFIYLTNLLLVAATQMNGKSWPFGSLLCTIYHGTETTGKYASVIFVVLLAGDRYLALCRPSIAARYRNYHVAVYATIVGWIVAFAAAMPLYVFAELARLRLPLVSEEQLLCIARWPSPAAARGYIAVCSVLVFVIPLALIVFFYCRILRQLRSAIKSSKRMKRSASSRTPYQRVTRLVLWIIFFHGVCWTPFWLFNLFSSIFRLRVTTQFHRIVVNIIHLFPYLNCALNPLLYALHAENFQTAFRSLFCIAVDDRQSSIYSRAKRSVAKKHSMAVRPSLMTTPLNKSCERLLSVHCPNGRRSSSIVITTVPLGQPMLKRYSIVSNGVCYESCVGRKFTFPPTTCAINVGREVYCQ